MINNDFEVEISCLSLVITYIATNSLGHYSLTNCDGTVAIATRENTLNRQKTSTESQIIGPNVSFGGNYKQAI